MDKAREKILKMMESEIMDQVVVKYDKKYTESAKNEEPMLGWFVPKCPNCNNILGQKFASRRLVCLVCSKEFELIEP
ncbi:MAG: hypothetical protein ABR962_02835 [Candidatus Bathyarchaeia archaeon]